MSVKISVCGPDTYVPTSPCNTATASDSSAAYSDQLGFLPQELNRIVSLETQLKNNKEHTFKAVMVVHNETSTGVTSRIPEIRQAIDRTGHPTLLMVDTISSLGSMEYRHEEWGVDVTVRTEC